jgi:hypothetical protein
MPMTSNFFICPGAQKAGTTSLHDLLSQHPQIVLPQKKETKYFINADSVDRDQYFSRFFAGKSNKVTGEIDPDYMFDPSVPQKLFDAFGPGLKLIFLMRNPVDRAYSHYWMSYRRGFETETFERAFELESTRLASGDNMAYWHQSYFFRGFYTQQIDRFLQYFDKKNCLFINFDDFVNDRSKCLKTILMFLEVDENYTFNNMDIHSNEAGLPRSRFLSVLHGHPPKFLKYFRYLIPNRKFRWTVMYPFIERLNISREKPRKMNPATRVLLADYYADEIERIQEMFGITTEPWGTA